MDSLYHLHGVTQTSSRPCTAILRRVAETFIGAIWLEDESGCQLVARFLTDRAGNEFIRLSLYGFGQRFRALLRPASKTYDWESDFVGYLIVGPRRYLVGARFSHNGLLKIWMRPMHLHATPAPTLEVVR